MMRHVIRVTAAVFMLCVGAVSYAEPSLAQLQAELVGSWLAQLDDQDTNRTLKIMNVSRKSEGSYSLEANFGFSGKNLAEAKAEINQSATERKLILNTRSGARIVAVQTPDGSFVGKFEGNDGIARGLKISKMSESDIQAKVESVLKGPEIVKPGADVPPQCAAYSGRWTGTWGWNTGQTWLSIIEIDAKCVAKFTYPSNPRPSTRFQTAEIKNGELSIPCGSGTCTFEVRGEEIWGRYAGPEGTNNVVKKKI